MTRFKNRSRANKYNNCPKCGRLKRKESLACRLCYTHVSPLINKKAIIESFEKLFN